MQTILKQEMTVELEKSLLLYKKLSTYFAKTREQLHTSSHNVRR